MNSVFKHRLTKIVHSFVIIFYFFVVIFVRFSFTWNTWVDEIRSGYQAGRNDKITRHGNDTNFTPISIGIFRVYFIYDKKPQLCCTRFPAAFIHPRGYPLAPAASPILRFKNAISVRFSISPRSFARSCNSSDRPREIFHVSCLHLERKQSNKKERKSNKKEKKKWD